jgi:hypothetical protein
MGSQVAQHPARSWQTGDSVALDLFPGNRIPPMASALFAEIGDPEGTRTITSIIALLVALGIALVLIAVWLYRSTRPDPELLAPLEVMGERKWRRRDPVWQRRRLDELRPEGAEPLSPSAAPPEVDESFDAGPLVSGFDDLRAVRVPPSGPMPSGTRSERPSETPPRTPGKNPPGTTSRTGRPDGDGPSTPVDAERPPLDEVPEGDIDPEILAAARAELDRELAERAGPRQLDLFLDGRSSEDEPTTNA